MMGPDRVTDVSFRGTVAELTAVLTAFPQDTRVMVFDHGSVTEKLSIQFWPNPWDDSGPAVVIDCD